MKEIGREGGGQEGEMKKKFQKGEMHGGREKGNESIRLKIALYRYYNKAYQHKSCFPGRGEESTVQRSLASSEISSREQSKR